MIVDANPLTLILKNYRKRVSIKVFDDEENPIDEAQVDLQVQTLDDEVLLTDSYTSPPPDDTRIVRTGVGQYYILWGDPSIDDNEETTELGKTLFVWSVIGADGSEEKTRVQTVEVVSARMLDRIRAFQEQIDKARKDVSVDPEDFCPLGYTEGMLLEYLRGGMTIINSYQPYPTWCSVETFPDTFLQNLFDAALVVGINAQTLFAIDSDIEQWSDQGNAFVINHQPKLAAFSTNMSQRLDKLIPQMKLHFVRSGSVKVESNSAYRLNELIQMAPNGALFRGVFLRS